ncbi:mycothiol synthase [Nesterenkonia alba]|uniref:mycothiol synthase n=1 Tax=Nesterenkonia alba TaxID=515814 RepID=UPI000684D8A5|nr:mycothiol synthase [Nesterenkonia alba]
MHSGDLRCEIELTEAIPSTELVEEVLALGQAAQSADGAPPFSDQTAAALRTAETTSTPPLVATVRSEGELVAAAVVTTGEDAPTVVELAVHPEHRNQGLATALAERLAAEPLATAPGTVLRAWAHGNHPGAAALAERFKWAPMRELWVMRLHDPEAVGSGQLPAGVRLRSFRPGEDEQAWLAANAAAFADHPEQGRITLPDLQSRMSEEWFDADGFLLAERVEDGEILGFHWTKIHPLQPGEAGNHTRHGEVYVVGVVPSAQGTGLGRSLTAAGIEHLRNRGVDDVILYVDASNTPAVRLYEKLGFTVWKADTQYAPIVEPTAEPAG